MASLRKVMTTNTVPLSLQQYTLYFRRVDIDYYKGYAVLALVDTCYTKDYEVFMLMGTAYSMYYVVFSGGDYYLYYALRGIFGGWILFILCTTQYFRGVILKGIGAY